MKSRYDDVAARGLLYSIQRQMFDPLKYSVSHLTSFSTPQVIHFNSGFCASLSVLVLIIFLISSKLVASISGNLAEDPI